MAVDVRFEVWTRPDTGTFVRKFPLTDVVLWELQLGLFGRGSITIPANHPRLNDIVFVDPTDHTNDAGSLIRAFIGVTHLYDFYAQRMETSPGETQLRLSRISGTGPGLALEHTIVFPKDYAGTDWPESVEPDWIYGPPNLLLTNPGFEDGFPDETFETLDPGGWAELTDVDPWGDTYLPLDIQPDVSMTEADAGVYSLKVGFGAPPSGVVRTLPVTPGSRIQISYKFKEPTANGDRYVIFAEAASLHHTNGWLFNGYAFAELDAAVRFAGAADGTWQTLDLDITVGDEQTVINLGVSVTDASGSGDMPTAYIDTGVYTGDGLGLAPWVPHITPGGFTVFESVATPTHSGSRSLKFQTPSMANGKARYGPLQTVFCGVGVQYNLSAWIYHTSGVDEEFRIGFKRYSSGWTAGLGDVTVPTATWTQISTNGIATQQAYDFTVRWVNNTGGPAASPVFYVDDCAMGIGEPASLYGKIQGDLLTDAATGHAPGRTSLAWLTKTFTDTLDSDTAAWDNEIQTRISRGQTYRQVTTFHTDTFGYEARIRPDPADHTDIQFDLFNPDTMGTDYTATDGGAVVHSGIVSVGPIIRREPRASYGMIEGGEQRYGEDSDADIEGAWGEIEVFTNSDEYLEGALDTIAARLTTGKEAETVVVSFQNPNLVPGIDYVLGDRLMLNLGEDVLPAAKYRVVDIVILAGDPEPVFQVQFVSEGV